ncbi:uncharacterized protein LOC109544405 isoform X3 [Dendroctonus ponderosae]|nr:uncharacterized protein LOC109544405 isoform X3 [Dendroctonus ponderosae]
MEAITGVSEVQPETLPYSGTDQHGIDSYKNIGNSEISHESAGKSDADSGSDIDQEEKDDLDPDDVNKFRFSFPVSYNKIVESALYPCRIANRIRKYDQVKYFSIMKISSTKAVCLVCNCEINDVRIRNHLLMSHVMGSKHLKSSMQPQVLQLVEFYHDFWLNKDPCIQAHQVYLRPIDLTYMQCSLCDCALCIDDIVGHIQLNPHKKNVIHNFESRVNSNYLIDLQVEAYGIRRESVEGKKDVESSPETNRKEKQKLEEIKKYADGEGNPEPRDNEAEEQEEQEEQLHNIIKAVEHPTSSNILKLLPNRMKSFSSCLQLIPNRGVYCDLCHFFLSEKVNIIEHFLMTPAHRAAKSLQYNYYCDICDTWYKSEHAWLYYHNFSGPRHLNMAASRRNKVTEYECTTCRLVIFGDNLSLSRHKMQKRKSRKNHRGTVKLPPPIRLLFKSKENICAVAENLAKEAEDVLRNSLTRDCCKQLESVLLAISPNCRVYPFGSRVSGLGNKDSDLDVFVDMDEDYFGKNFQDAKKQVMLIRGINKILQKHKDFAGTIPVLSARTPILKLYHIPTKLDCDLSFKHGLSVENTKFLRLCIEMQPVCQRLILLVKSWAGYIIFENITTYALAMLCIFYLQTHGYLISVDKLFELNKHKPINISGWKTIAYALSLEDMKLHIKPYQGTLTELMEHFFKYYCFFDFASDVACPLLGKVVKRSLFEGDIEKLPPQMDTYITQLTGDDPEFFRSNSPMCIQDPFDLSHNLTKAVHKTTLIKFQEMCKLSYEYLKQLH